MLIFKTTPEISLGDDARQPAPVLLIGGAIEAEVLFQGCDGFGGEGGILCEGVEVAAGGKLDDRKAEHRCEKDRNRGLTDALKDKRDNFVLH